jgi:hypothetical protein
MLAAIPGIAAVVSVYGLIANPNDVNGASTVLEALLPPGAGQMLIITANCRESSSLRNMDRHRCSVPELGSSSCCGAPTAE